MAAFYAFITIFFWILVSNQNVNHVVFAKGNEKMSEKVLVC